MWLFFLQYRNKFVSNTNLNRTWRMTHKQGNLPVAKPATLKFCKTHVIAWTRGGGASVGCKMPWVAVHLPSHNTQMMPLRPQGTANIPLSSSISISCLPLIHGHYGSREEWMLVPSTTKEFLHRSSRKNHNFQSLGSLNLVLWFISKQHRRGTSDFHS